MRASKGASSALSHIAILTSAFGMTLSAKSADVSIVPRLEVSEAYTDNVFLADDAQSDFVTSVQPGITAEVTGRRFNLRADYDLGYLYFADADEDQFRHNGQAALRFDVLENILALEGTAGVAEQFNQRGAGISISPFNLSDDRQTVQTYTVGPRLNLRMRDIAQLTARFDYRKIETDFDAAGDQFLAFNDAEGYNGNFRLASGPVLGRLQIAAFGNIAELDRASREGNPNVADFENSQIGGELLVPVTSRLILTGRAGYFDSSATTVFGDGDGFFWNVGVRYNGPKLSLNVSGGEQGLATTANASINYRVTARTQLTLSYVDQFRSNQSVLLDGNQDIIDRLPGEDQNLDPLPPIPGFQLNNNDFRTQRGSASITHTRERLTVTLNGFYEQRTFDGSNTNSDGYGGTLTTRYDLSRQSNIRASFTYRDDAFGGISRDDQVYLGSVNYSRDLNSFLTTGASFSYSRRDSSTEGFDLQENVVSIFLRATF